MAPQNLSFIETESEKEDKSGGGGGTSDEREAVSATGRESRSLTPSDPLKRLPERLSQLNISSGSKGRTPFGHVVIIQDETLHEVCLIRDTQTIIMTNGNGNSTCPQI